MANKPASKSTAAARKPLAPSPAPAPRPAARGADPRRSDDEADDGSARARTGPGHDEQGAALGGAAAPPTPTQESAVTANDASTLAGNEGGAVPVDPAVVVRRRVIGADQDMVKVKVPRAFRFNDGAGIHEYDAATTEMPAEHADHWYAKAHGVERA